MKQLYTLAFNLLGKITGHMSILLAQELLSKQNLLWIPKIHFAFQKNILSRKVLHSRLRGCYQNMLKIFTFNTNLLGENYIEEELNHSQQLNYIKNYVNTNIYLPMHHSCAK